MSEDFVYERPHYIAKAELAEKLGFDVVYFFKKVNNEPSISEQLKKAGYKKTSKNLTPKQMEIICEYYGYPIIKEK
ncbi:MAG: DUF4248 domain-containing protein [Bacteroidales bacterium]|nr:DUF4248 domain-containing protein [Bacteroidales bacterium]